MKKNPYNSNDEEYLHVKKLLSELPKIKAPDNFEFNLSVKIKNKNFGLNIPEKNFLLPWKILVPISGTVAAVFIFFFISIFDTDSSENPFQIQPQLRKQSSANFISNVGLISNLSPDTKISENDVVIKENNKNESVKLEANSETTLSNDQKIVENKEKKSFPFNEYNATNLDQVLSEKRSGSNISSRAALTGSNNSAFNGFFIREEVDKEYVEAMKARMDSLKREMKNNKKAIKVDQ